MKLSIIVPVYNIEKYLASTLDSLLDIVFPYDYEIILVNDGSTDNSRSIMEEYSEKNDNISLINQSNSGVSNARNTGLRFAGGDYIAFVDGDDLVEKNFFRIAVQELDDGYYDFVQANLCKIVGDKVERIMFNSADSVFTDRDCMLENFFGHQKMINNSSCAKVFRAERIKNKQFDSTLKIAEDQKFIFDTLIDAQKIKILSAVGYYYVQRPDSVMHSLNRAKAQDILQVLEYCRRKVDSDRIRSLIDTDKMDVLFFVYHDFLLHGESHDDTYKEIKGMNPQNMWSFMSRNAKLKRMLLCNCRRLYDLMVLLLFGLRAKKRRLKAR